ncbi:MAG: aminotransferase class I/II-fold pyridoxal phosphate-dependent enzyme [Pseudomonadota bacterium]|nr:aminotransferase class I/II-fold pyridoxal phosphate-dependent enzyme [Pseudomonadota bacterium]
MAPEGRYGALARRVDAAGRDGLLRRLRLVEPTGGTEARVDGRVVTLFCSNDYLGLADHPEILAAYTGGGAGASRLISGNRPAHVALEEALGELYGRPATLFGSGFTANLALLTTLLTPADTVASDALNHASIIDGVRLSGAKKVILPHGQPAIPAGARMAVVEGLYSMDGDVLDLPRYFGPDHWLAVDESHSFGCLGPGGRGAALAKGVVPDFLMGTLGKALGVLGAFVIGPPELRELLVSFGRTFVYTTGLPEPIARAALVALRLADAERRERLAHNARRLRIGLWQIGASALGDAHVAPVVTGERTMAITQGLLDKGYYVAGIRWPTVPRGQERVRITVSAAHTDAQIDGLLDALDGALR